MTDLNNIPIIGIRNDGYRLIPNVHDLPIGIAWWWTHTSNPGDGSKWAGWEEDTKARTRMPNPMPVLIEPVIYTERVPWYESVGRIRPSGKEIRRIGDNNGIKWVNTFHESNSNSHDEVDAIDENGTVEVLSNKKKTSNKTIWVALPEDVVKWRANHTRNQPGWKLKSNILNRKCFEALEKDKTKT